MAEAEAEKPGEIRFEGQNPIVRVENLDASIDFYVNKLGFKLNWRTRYLVSVRRGKVDLFLAEGDQGHSGGWVWIGVSNVRALCADYESKGAKIRHLPTNYPWALEMQVEDPDGNVLRMGSESLEGEPFGEWLDMYGQIWPPESEI
jgi:catechol 2,3-dioxygenase-like lactoylglutathione lyase family enzyme